MKRIFALLLVGFLLATPVFALQKSLIDQTVANTPVQEQQHQRAITFI